MIENLPYRKIGLALSGGGYRAAAFHLGVIRSLSSLGLLDKIAVISGVSGGSMIAAAYGLRDDSTSFDEAFRGHLLKNKMIKASDILKGFTYFWDKRLSRLERAAEKHLFGKRTLDELSTSPRIFIGATELGTGKGFYFAPALAGFYRMIAYDPHAGDQPIDLEVALNAAAPASNRKISTAFAASAAVPGVFNPMTLKDKVVKQRLKRDRVVLVDGGVYDNLGVMPLLGISCDWILVSDAASPFFEDPNPGTHTIDVLGRVVEILGSQASNASRLREAQGYQAAGQNRLTHLPITYEPADADPLHVHECCNEKTRLEPSATIEKLIKHGAAVANQILKRELEELGSKIP